MVSGLLVVKNGFLAKNDPGYTTRELQRTYFTRFPIRFQAEPARKTKHKGHEHVILSVFLYVSKPDPKRKITRIIKTDSKIAKTGSKIIKHVLKIYKTAVITISICARCSGT